MKKTLTYVCCLLLAVSANAQLPQFQWAGSIGGPAGDWPYSIKTDAGGNVYTAGFYTDSADFDPGPATHSSVSNGYRDMFITKLDATGNFIWAMTTGGVGNDEVHCMDVDGHGNIYVGGIFHDLVDFDPGSAIDTMRAPSYEGFGFIAKYSPSGSLLWARSTFRSYPRAIARDAAGNLYTAGSFTGTVDFDPGPGTANLYATGGNSDIYVSKFTGSGSFVWAGNMSGGSDEIPNCITLDASANVYIGGWFKAAVDFDPGPGLHALHANGVTDGFVAKLDSAGSYMWAQQVGCSSTFLGAQINSLATDISGNIISAGYFGGTADFDPGPATYTMVSSNSNNPFLWKLDSVGNFTWAKQLGVPANSSANADAIAVDAAGSIYIKSMVMNVVDFDPGPGTYTLASQSLGYQNAVIYKLDAGGNFKWALPYGRADVTSGSSLCIDAFNNIYTTGFYGATTDFDPGPSTFNLTGVGSFDVFVQKLSQDGVAGIDESSALAGVSVYPNPTDGALTIRYASSQADKGLRLQVQDVLGQAYAFELAFSEGLIRLDLQSLPSGMYIVSVSNSETTMSSYKIVKR